MVKKQSKTGGGPGTNKWKVQPGGGSGFAAPPPSDVKPVSSFSAAVAEAHSVWCSFEYVEDELDFLESGEATPEVLLLAVGDSSAHSVRRLALEKLRGMPVEDVNASAADMMSASEAEALSAWLSVDSVAERFDLADAGRLSPESLILAMADEDPGVRCAAFNGYPLTILQANWAFEDEDESVQAAPLYSDHVSEEIFEAAVNSGDFYVQVEAAGHPGCPTRLLQELSRSESYDVRETARSNLDRSFG